MECIGKPELQRRPVAVCGDPERRHGIILAKNECAKKFGIRTGEAIVVAKAKCPNILLLPAHHKLYVQYSQATRELYRHYTDKIESFGIDECWLDVTESRTAYGDGLRIANELRAATKKELGLSISAGVSYNKTFAKMGSDYKKPDATTHISRENFKELLWPLPVESMMFAGPSTVQKLHLFSVRTIGQLANMPLLTLKKYFGKPGLDLYFRSNGYDPTPIAKDTYSRPPESIGNSVTCPYDLENEDQIKAVFFMLCDSVATRLRKNKLKCGALSILVKNNRFEIKSRRKLLKKETQISSELLNASLELWEILKKRNEPIRSLGVCAEKLLPESSLQISLFDDSCERAKKEKLEETVDALRGRFGKDIIGSALYLAEPVLTDYKAPPKPPSV